MSRRNVSSKSTIFSLSGAVLGLALSGVAAAPAAETVTVTTEDGIPCSFDLYRPRGGGSVEVILLPDLPGSRADWAAVAETLAARGCLAAAPDLRPLRGAGGAKPVWGRADDPLTPWTDAWREVVAVQKRLREESAAPRGRRRSVLVGAGTGGAAAAVAASRLPAPPDLLVLVLPAARLAGIPITPVLAGLEMPLLLLSPLDASVQREVATDVYLSSRARATLWMTGPPLAQPVRIFALRPQLSVDLAAWIVGESARLREAGEVPPSDGLRDERAR